MVGHSAGECHAFGLYIFQQVQRWPKDGEVDYKSNLFRYAAYLTPSCKVFLEKDFEFRRNAGELRGESAPPRKSPVGHWRERWPRDPTLDQ